MARTHLLESRKHHGSAPDREQAAQACHPDRRTAPRYYRRDAARPCRTGGSDAQLTYDDALRDPVQTDAGGGSGELIDTAPVACGGQLRLLRFGSNFSIRLGEDELMGSEAVASEQALAELTIQRMGERRDRVLIGGLGMGFTLRAALAGLPATTAIVVAELVPAVVNWARGPLAHLFGDALGDARVTIEMRDVHDVILASPGGFDAIMLDVDNGPDGFIDVANDRLYCNWGLRASYAALRPGGVLAVWSAYDDSAFFARLGHAGFVVEEVKVSDPGGRERAPYTIWLAIRPEHEADGVSPGHGWTGNSFSEPPRRARPIL